MITYRQPFRNEWPITQQYGERVTSAFHTGIDYGCPAGTHILASADGTVMAAGWDNSGYGFRVILKHGDGRATLYAHLDSISVNLFDKVLQGEEIGISGNTGNTTGPHLHFEARSSWSDYHSHFDPMKLPLRSVVDYDVSPVTGTLDSQASQTNQSLETQQAAACAPLSEAGGWVRVICELPAMVRDVQDPIRIVGQKNKGDVFRVTEGVKMIWNLPYRRIIPEYVDDLGGYIAEHDSYGNQMLEAYGKEESN